MRVNIIVQIFMFSQTYKMIHSYCSFVKGRCGNVGMTRDFVLLRVMLGRCNWWDFVRFISLKVEVFLYSLLVSKLLNFSKKKKKRQAFLTTLLLLIQIYWALRDQIIWKKSVILGLFSNLWINEWSQSVSNSLYFKGMVVNQGVGTDRR